MKKKRDPSEFLSLLLLIMLITVNTCYGQPPPPLSITVATDKQTYALGETVNIFGNLTLDGKPVKDGLVAIEVRDPKNLSVVFRTEPSGIIPSILWPLNFTELFPCNSQGIPTYTFQKGEQICIFFTVKNHGAISRDLLVTISILDSNLVPIVTRQPLSKTLEPGEQVSQMFGAGKIPNWASVGEAKICANAYTSYPKNGGTPYCPEDSVSFQITSTASAPSTENSYTHSSNFENNLYNSTFRLRCKEINTGNFTVYVSSNYHGEQASNNVMFEVILVGDINDDGKVDMEDIRFVCKAFGSRPGDDNWDPRCDIDENGKVDMEDIRIVCHHFGEQT